MTQAFSYHQAIDASPTFDVDLGTEAVRLGEEQGFTELAEHMQSGSSTVVIDDPDGTVGNAGDHILGNQRFDVDEDDCSAPRIIEGFIGIRRYARGDGARPSLVTGSQRQIEVELHDLNSYASFRVIPDTNRDAIRPRETVDARFAWISGTGYLAYIHDNGLIASNTTMMDAHDYRGQRPVNVINDCEIAAGFGWNAFVYWDDAAAEASWWFGNSNTSTDFSSTLRISNVLSDCDTLTAAGFESGTTFAPAKDGVLTRDPTEQGDTAYVPFKNGSVNVTRTATTNIYGQKDLIAPNANVETKARARAIAQDYLFQHRNEEDRITCTVELPTSKVNLIKAGHRIEVKFQHLPGYESFTWCRVLRRTVMQRQKTEARYQVELELSPQEEGLAAAVMVQCKSTTNVAATTVTMDSDVTIGNLLIARMITDNDDTIPEMFPGEGWVLYGSGAARNLVGAQPRGAVAVYAKIADSTNPIIGRDVSGQRQFTVCEISGRGLADITAFSTSHATGGSWSPGSGGGTIGLYIIAVPRGDDSHGNGYDISPTGAWTIEHNTDIHGGAACAFAPPDPWWWAAKIENQTNVDLAVTISPVMCGTLNVLGEWCAAAIFV